MDKCEWNDAKDYYMLKKEIFLPNIWIEEMFNKILHIV